MSRISIQILIYGAFDFTGKIVRSTEFQEAKYMATSEMIELVKECTFENDFDSKEPRASVVLHESFEHLPPALFIVAELDPLKDDSHGKYIFILTTC